MNIARIYYFVKNEQKKNEKRVLPFYWNVLLIGQYRIRFNLNTSLHSSLRCDRIVAFDTRFGAVEKFEQKV